MYKEETAIAIENLGKMYKLYKNPKDKIKDAFGLNSYKKNYYKEFWALRDVNIKIKKGERVGLIGHNGAGKSTLLKTIIGNIQPTEGNIKIQGSIQALLELGTGFHPEFTGRENIKASLAYQGAGLTEIAAAEKEIIEFTELGEYIDQPVRTYSAGMYSRLAFATATAVCPEVLIIDEVLGAGDAYFMGKCVERMRRLTSEEGTTVLFVSHDLQSVQALCDRVIWIDKGMMRFDGEVLKGIKLYTQSVRENEELRLKIRDMKISKNQAMVIDRKQDLYDEYLFHFISNKRECICKIYDISVFADNVKVAHIDVGAPMDNNLELDNYVIDDIESACWGKTKKDSIGYYREYNNLLGQNHHAPFHIMVSKEYQDKKLEIVIKMSVFAAEGLEFQSFDYEAGDYKTYPMLSMGENEYIITVNNNGIKDDNTGTGKELELSREAEEKVIDNIETAQARFERVVLIDKEGKEKKVFSYEKGISECVTAVKFKVPCSKFIFVFCLYSMKGDLIISSCQQVEVERQLEKAEIHYKFPDMRLGAGEYTISIAIYDELDIKNNNKEQKFLALLDRGVSFKIENPLEYALNVGFFTPNEVIEIAGLSKEEIKCNLMI